jgi:hypothetical protein
MMMSRRVLAARFFAGAALLLLVVPPAVAQHAHRHGAHAHGESRLGLAIEAGRLEIELESPAVDIVGFEHAPRTPAQAKALADARARLADGSALIVSPAAAGCRLDAGRVETKGPIGGAGQLPAAKSGEAPKAGGDGEHSEIVVRWALNCSAPDKLDRLEIGLFKAFKGMGRITATLVGPKGQRSVTLKRGAGTLDLRGVN